jgi:hypothetical protein
VVKAKTKVQHKTTDSIADASIIATTSVKAEDEVTPGSLKNVEVKDVKHQSSALQMSQGSKKSIAINVPKLPLSNITQQTCGEESKSSPVKKDEKIINLLKDKSSVRTLEGLIKLNATIEKDK